MRQQIWRCTNSNMNKNRIHCSISRLSALRVEDLNLPERGSGNHSRNCRGLLSYGLSLWFEALLFVTFVTIDVDCWDLIVERDWLLFAELLGALDDWGEGCVTVRTRLLGKSLLDDVADPWLSDFILWPGNAKQKPHIQCWYRIWM